MNKIFKVALCFGLSVILVCMSFCALGVVADTVPEDTLYYRTLSLAFGDINVGELGAHALPDSGLSYANVKVVVADNSYDVYMLNNTIENDTITVQTDKQVNVYFDKYVAKVGDVGFDIMGGNVYFEAVGRGGITSNGSAKARCVQLRSGNLTVKNGFYNATATNGTACCVQSAGDLTMYNATMVATYHKGQSRCISTVQANDVDTKLVKCNMTAFAKQGRSIVFYNAVGCYAELQSCVARAYSNYHHSETESYAQSSVGIDNRGEMRLKQCNVFGTHSGVQSTGRMMVVGGNYTGYGHGGFYISGANNFARIYNAYIACVPMPAGYSASVVCNQAGIYIGGQGSHDTRVYMNNCHIDAKTQPIVLRGSSGEKNNTLYISNSTMITKKKVRMDSNHRLFLGVGNNFNHTHTSAPKRVFNTGLTY